jgi:hypothetical protein
MGLGFGALPAEAGVPGATSPFERRNVPTPELNLLAILFSNSVGTCGVISL